MCRTCRKPGGPIGRPGHPYSPRSRDAGRLRRAHAATASFALAFTLAFTLALALPAFATPPDPSFVEGERRHDALDVASETPVDLDAAALLGGAVGEGEATPGLHPEVPGSEVLHPEVHYEAHRSRLESAWFAERADPLKRAEQLERLALEYGAEMENAARALIAHDAGESRLPLAQSAVRIAPDLPLAHMALARALFAEGEYGDALPAVFAGIAAIPRHLEASLWLAGSVLLMLASVMIASSLVCIAAIGLSRSRDAAHDIGDVFGRHLPGFGRAALLATVVVLPLAFGEGLLGLLLVLFAVGFVYGTRKHRVALLVSAAMAVLGLYPILHGAGMALGALDADPLASASLAVVRGNETPSDLALLARHEKLGDELAARILAMRSSRMGRLEEAESRFERLAIRVPDDVRILTALGNLAFRQGRTEAAIDYYERAGAVDAPAILLFDLSQAYAKQFRMDEMEQSLHAAQNLDPVTSMTLSGLGDTELVADLPFDVSVIRARMLEATDGGAFSGVLGRMLAPGRIGRSWQAMSLAFAAAALLAASLAGRFRHASLCERCGKRICARCDDSMWSSEMCDSCHHLFHRPQGTDPDLRMARLEALRVRSNRIDRLQTACSLVVPGAAGLLARRPGLCLAGLLFFAWTVVLFLWRDGAVPDPLAVGAAGPLAFGLAGCVAAALHLAVVVSGLKIRRRL